jgi:predicted DCC family thiol-disulfide oxidoreductase YuxK
MEPVRSDSRPVLLYDGQCPFCATWIRRLERIARPGAFEALSYHDPSVPERFPGLQQADLEREMHLVEPHGRVTRGFEVAIRALRSRPVAGALTRIYYVPGLRQLLDSIYRLIARYRHRLPGRCGDPPSRAESNCSRTTGRCEPQRRGDSR